MISLRKKPSKHSVNTDIMRGNPSSVTSAGGVRGTKEWRWGGGASAVSSLGSGSIVNLKKKVIKALN